MAAVHRRARARRSVVLALGLGSLLAVAACGGGDPLSGSSSSTSSSGGGALTVGGANFTEMQIMEQMYGQLLTKAGYTVDYKAVDNREIYAPALSKGDIDVVPEYAATMAEYLNAKANGADAPLIATNDAQATVAAMKPLAEAQGLTVLQPAAAADQNGFAVKKDFASQNNLKTLSDLAALKQPIVLAATTECPTRPFCGEGLKKTYGLNISKVEPLGFGTPQAKQAVVSGKAQLVLTGTTDATLDALGLVLLEDDKKLQLADNLVPIVNTKSAGKDDKVATTLNALSSVLTTEDLGLLNAKVDGERQKVEDVAKEYLTSKGLL
jgi:osmoprotectant transport system substrate-binding protein